MNDTLERVRALLPVGHAIREVPMFGGLPIMLDEKMLVSVRRDGGLLVRVGGRVQVALDHHPIRAGS